jgi:hypothetical protein
MLILAVWLVATAALIPRSLAASPALPTCDGDCNRDRRVTADELALAAAGVLGTLPASACLPADRNIDQRLTIDELIGAITRARDGCPTCLAFSRDRNAYYGDLHVHSTYSFDAHIYDVRGRPEDAYRFARGDTVLLPPLDANGQGTRPVRIDRPLDFTAVTDHSEFLGEVEICSTPGAPGYDSPTCEVFRTTANIFDADEATRTFGLRLTSPQPRFEDVCGADAAACLTPASTVWDRVQAAAEAAYDRSPACSFTTFVAYEYSAGPAVSTLHRNVIFRNARVSFPTSYFEEPTPQGLWARLRADCLDAGTGCDVLAIPHNSNESTGRMFLIEYPGAQSVADERTQAALRSAIEPLAEIYQHKGDSECFNGLSGIVGAPDELCEFEKRRVLADCGEGIGSLGTAQGTCASRSDFLRGALLIGLQEDERLGVNPYRLGFIGSTDTHNATPGAVAEDRFLGHRGTDDGTTEGLLGRGRLTPGGVVFSPGGLAAVWAEENSRDAIFNALRRRETFATSGPRIAVRFFGGWDFTPALCQSPDPVARADAAGVPMGATLTGSPPGASPRFLVSALRDAGTEARPGTPLQRIQIVKGWLENGERRYAVHDVAGDPANGATVDLETCTPVGAGADSLCTVWTDPDFQPHEHAYYYARVVENPSCRWNTYLCNALPPEGRPATCTNPEIPKTVQERAWTSPIWYRPGA